MLFIITGYKPVIKMIIRLPDCKHFDICLPMHQFRLHNSGIMPQHGFIFKRYKMSLWDTATSRYNHLQNVNLF
jgi:hypothetical protein